MPKTRVTFWREKFRKNVARDVKVRRALQKSGWKVVTVWECEIDNEKKLERKLLRAISGTS